MSATSCSGRYLKGTRPTIRWSFYDIDGDLATPGALTITTRDPDNDQEVYVMPHATIALISVGVIDFTFPDPLTIVGEWWAYAATGDVAHEQSLDIVGVHVSV